MLSLYKSERFQKELETYREHIEKVTDLRIKSNLENQLNKLINQVKNLDAHHEEMIFSKQIKEMSGENRDKITEIRKTLDRMIKDYFLANNIKLKQSL